MVAATANTAGVASIFLLLRAFASGAVALTGTEAIATGVPAFKPPESRNAATTLLVMAGVLATLFIGVTFLATNFAIYPTVPELFGHDVEHKTVIAQVAETVFGSGSIPFYLFQAFTALLLFLAANTSFAAFPRLAAVLGEDGFFPRQFALRGDRLAFSMGIVLLGLDRGLAGDRRRRPHPRAHPAVRGRRVHRLHHQPGRHDPPLAPDARTRLALPARHQCRSAVPPRPSSPSS